MPLVLPAQFQLAHPDHSPLLPDCLFEEGATDSRGVDTILPVGFPTSIDSPLAWKPSNLDETYFVYYLTEADRAEIEAALFLFKSYGLDGDLVNQTNFCLSNLQRKLRKLSSDLHNGQGFFILRGLDNGKHSVEDNMIIFLGIQSYIAEQRARQDEIGNMLVHILTDDKESLQPLREFHTRHSRKSIPFHADDIGDILAFQVRSMSLEGGSSILAPSYTIYNELVATRPDVIHTLAKPNWPLHIPYYHERPLLFYEDCHLILNFTSIALLGSKVHPRSPSLPALSPAQLEALTLVQSLAYKHELAIPLQVGDLYFFNNLALLHRRDDSGIEIGSGQCRHLVRLCVRSREMGWMIPGALLGSGLGWSKAYVDNDEDSDDPDDTGKWRERVWHVEPMPDDFYPLTRKSN